ncbi:MAG: MBL fold metallo-hydrolase [Proteobacteria bacterium]|nr:MBL fold metallo-hydrolase [Pseudomonadota bacterium]
MTVRAVHHLNCATMCPALGRLVLGIDRMISHCLLVETARDGLVLVDTGFGTRDVERKTRIGGMFHKVVRPTLDPAETAIAHVRALGFQPRDVRHVVVTHLDLDHAGGLADFPDAVVHLHAREHAAAIARATVFERERYLPEHWHHGPKWAVYTEDGDTWRGMPAVTKLRGVDADIALVPLHGHTRGHSAIAVDAGDRWMLHAGDAYFSRKTIERASSPLGFAMFERTMQVDGRARKASVAALRDLHAGHPDVQLFCAHDVDEFTTAIARARAN